MNLLFVHGFMGSAINWGGIRVRIEKLGKEAGFEIKTFAFNLLGHADRRIDSIESFSSAHDAVVSVLEDDIKALHIDLAVGHSFGFRPLLLAAIKNPKLVPAIIVEDSSPDLSSRSLAFLRKILRETPVPFRTRELAREYLESNFGLQVGRFLMSNIRTTPDGLNSWRFDQPFLDRLLDECENHPLWKQWESYQGRGFLMTGANSDQLSDQTIQKMAQLRLTQPLPQAIIQGAGHWIHADKPEEFCKNLLEVIRVL